jgi:hypothetical protein
MNKTIFILTTIVTIFWLAMMGALLVLPGCISPIGPTPNPNPGPPTPGGLIPDVITQIVYKTNWLSTLAIVGIALSAAAFVQGQKFALPLFAGCATLLATILTITQYAKWIAFVGFGVALVVFVYVTWQKRKEVKGLDTAFKEVVISAQSLKQKIIDDTPQHNRADTKTELNNILSEPQSDSTVLMVNKTKADLGLKTTLVGGNT